VIAKPKISPVAPAVEVPQAVNGKNPTVIAMGSQGGGLNSVELAAKLGVSKRTVQSWAKELGHTPPETKPKGKEAIAVPPHIFRDGKWYPINPEEN
jgi:hypothetical protein